MKIYSNPVTGNQDCVGLLMVYNAEYGIAPMVGVSGVIDEDKLSRPIGVGVLNHTVEGGTIFEAIPLESGAVADIKLKSGTATITVDMMGMPFTSTGQTGWAKSELAPSYTVGMVCTPKPAGGYKGGQLVSVVLSPAIHSATA